jgi:HAD superfamily hydrolase (TIGR01450 family)
VGIAGAWALDLDGVLWRGSVPIEGSAAAVARLRAAGHRVVFLTNNSAQPVADQVAKLVAMGVDAVPDDLLTSAQAAAALVEPGSTALVIGGAGIDEALAARGVAVVAEAPCDAVVVGFDRCFDFDRLTRAFLAVRSGARLIGTNDDATYPTPDGEIPGGGSMVAAVAYATGVAPTIAGKPFAGAVQLLADRVGAVDWFVGDRPSTDGAMARAIGARFGLVLSGVTASAAGVEPAADAVADDLASLVAQVAAG